MKNKSVRFCVLFVAFSPLVAFCDAAASIEAAAVSLSQNIVVSATAIVVAGFAITGVIWGARRLRDALGEREANRYLSSGEWDQDRKKDGQFSSSDFGSESDYEDYQSRYY